MNTRAGATIELRDIERSFVSGLITTRVLNGVTLDIHPNEMTLIVGPSGSGKSTLLAIASGLLRPSAGRVRAIGKNLGDLDAGDLDKFRLAHCGFIFQGFNLFASLTALEQVAYPLQFSKVAHETRKDRAHEALAAVGLAAKAALYPLELSGGEKQRVAIARAIAKEPRLLFADEPTSALDKDNGVKVARLLHEIAHARHATVVCVSHDQRLIDYADRVIQIEDGVISSDERLSRPNHGALGAVAAP
ncbi:MAG: ABC transporter ATP-binding protein [Methylocystaceae bacterium]|nr:MAG: ABC transporter ATP-binding protein [Methylocystaceae bacterium]